MSDVLLLVISYLKFFDKIIALFNIENINQVGYEPDSDKTLKS